MLPIRLITSCILCVFLTGYLNAQTQQSRIDVQLNDKTLMEFIKTIEGKSNYTFLVNSSVNLEKTMNVNARQQTVPSILEMVFRGSDITYEISGNQIILKNGVSDVVSGPIISGKVTDSDGNPIVGGSVIVKSTSLATVTDYTGHFNIAYRDPDDVLVVSYLGYVPREIVVGNRTEMNIVLQIDQQHIDEVIVIGYGSKNKSKIVGAVNQVVDETFANKAVTNVGQALQGAIPNLNISFTDGLINRSASFNIRGTNSINGGSPLVLIDGVPGNLNLISPEDIATLSVLKDASSAAIYGAQASYGVILVTTKRGETDKPRFRYTANFGFGQPLKTPNVLMDGLEHAKILQEAYTGWAGSEYAGLGQIINYLENYKEGESLPITFISNSYYGFVSGQSTDWYKLIYNDSQPYSKHFAEVSGKSDRVNYYLSAGVMNQDGVFRVGTDKLTRYSMRSKIDIQLNKSVKIYNNFSIENSHYDTPATTVTGNWSMLRYMTQICPPFAPPYDTEGNYTYGGLSSIGLLQDGGRTTQTINDVRNTFGAEIALFDDALKLKGDYSIWWDRSRGDAQRFQLSYATSPGVVSPLSAMSDYFKSSFTETIRQTINAYADFTKSFGNHNINIVAGFNQSEYIYNIFSAQINDNMFTNYASLNLGDGVTTVADSASDWATRGFFYRISYDYKSKYLAEFNGRLDGTSRFPKNHRWGFFPSVAVGWMISEENFMSFLKPTVSSLKIRASYGSLGNQQVDAYSYISTMSKKQMNHIVDGEKIYYMTAPGLVAGDLTWETVVSKNLGIDLSMFRNRLDIGFDIYERQTLNMLAAGESLPAVLGASAPKVNSADLSVKGWEASVMWRDSFKVLGKPANYSIRLVMSDYRAVITRYDGNDGQLISGYNVGEELGTIWGLETLGFFATDEEAIGWADQSEVTINLKNIGAGDIKFADRNKDGRITKGKQTLYDHGDLLRIGNSDIHFPYSIDLALDWNNFDLNVYFQGVGKRDFYPGGECAFFWGPYNRWNNQVMEHIAGNYWTPENPDAYFPRMRAYMAKDANNELGVPQTKYLQDASYLRLKTLTFGYTIPRTITQRVSIDKLRLFFTGQNLLTFTELHEAFDPEALANLNSNGAGFVYPIQKTFTFGIDLSF